VRLLNSFQAVGLLVLRVALGLIFLSHGYPKLTRPTSALQSAYLEHGLPAQAVYVVGVLETFGGTLLIIGLFARPASLLLAVEMGVMIVKLHGTHGIMALHEYEFPLTLGAACLAMATVGAGLASADHLLFGDGGSSRGPKPARK